MGRRVNRPVPAFSRLTLSLSPSVFTALPLSTQAPAIAPVMYTCQPPESRPMAGVVPPPLTASVFSSLSAMTPIVRPCIYGDGCWSPECLCYHDCEGWRHEVKRRRSKNLGLDKFSLSRVKMPASMDVLMSMDRSICPATCLQYHCAKR